LKPNIALSVLFLFSCLVLNAQDFKATNPLPIAPSLSGNFGELRANHFHAGIDLKTAGKEGIEVTSIDTGYVSRIKISSYGYGKVIYIDHPSGYTTVYAHLSSLIDSIGRYTKRIQYEQESFEIDVYPGKNDLPVSKGQLIALSGNSGGSGGPHLHFEVRETKSEVPRNPLLYGFPLNDTKHPIIEAIGIEPIGEHSSVNGAKHSYHIRTQGYAEKTLVGSNKIAVEGSFGISVNGYDEQNGSTNHNGIYQLKCFVDGALISTFTADSIAFDKSRYLNALIDYKHYYNYKTRFLKLYKIPGNRLENIQYKNDGILDLTEGTHSIKIEALDVEGNQCTVNFEVDVKIKNDHEHSETAEMLPFNVNYFHESEKGKVMVPAGATYEDLPLLYNEIENESAVSNTIEFMRSDQPLHTPFEIEIKPNDSIDHAESWLVARVSVSGGVIQALPSTWNNGYLRAESKSFGRFKIVKDATKPEIRSGNFTSGKYYTAGDLRFAIKDNMSGINTYRVLVNEQFVLADYDYKQDLLKIDVSDLPKSDEEQQLRIIVSDMAGNVATFDGSFYHK